ncbi:LOW QUALITY PROTEIN: hypothetical protein OSB04_028642 [Centaurea solstitialis]|uniref:Retrovirus-related Pol polyprotein from transposon TNT 1-94-like beta-barrel domain-containing protein n=1 Tax=Centaurea solstitialis TaxID=347529 RepID=A0AA38WBD8_9ASTR|nr:LOW QUALITY PROTEIN: hypothetical protein OSB04_028642 [Centaurea solstitialis]
MLKPNEFDVWKIRIRQYMLLTDYGMWEVVENGPGTDEEVAEGAPRPPPRSDADRKRRQTEMKVPSTLLLAIPNEYQHQFSSCTDAKALWTALEKRFFRTKSTKRNQKAILKKQYENFTSLKNESMTQTFDRFNKLIGELATVDVKMDKDDKSSSNLLEMNGLFTLSSSDKELEDLYNDLRIFESEVEAKRKPIGYSHNTALLSSENSNSFNTNASFNNTTAIVSSNSNTPKVDTTVGPLKRKPIIITKYSNHEIPSKDYLLKLNRLTENNQGRRSSLWHVDSGCSRHMTGIVSLLEDFKRFEGGHVAFGDNPTGGKISGKSKVSKGKMTFDDVYYVEQLRYNLLSVSQVCDKKFGVFFTDTKCLILAPGFKIDES